MESQKIHNQAFRCTPLVQLLVHQADLACGLPEADETWPESVGHHFAEGNGSSADSTGRRNTRPKFFSWGEKPQRFAWPLIELDRHAVEISL
ncbi:MAG: hypothetical protein IT488_03930 [Gammaproteobacteria bacterium]|nr:hypothetical protein [Gammaproteobacteria bacterium]